MNRSLRMDRRYYLGEYRWITLEDEIDDIPKDLVFNVDFITKARYLQLISTELAYRKYKVLVSNVGYGVDLEESIRVLEDIQREELKTLKDFINGEPLNEGKPLEE